MNITKTTCPYCGVGCGVEIHQDKLGKLSLLADKTHPANQGRLCSKGTALLDTIDHPDRLLFPEIDKQRVDWHTATGEIANRIHQVVNEYGSDAVAFYVSGQLLTEDYYVANKLMKGFIGSANIDTNSRLCMSSAVAAHKRAFGEDLVPCSYEDFELTDLVVLVGSNAAWCHPVLYQRIARAKKRNPSLRVVLIDPRKTKSADIADLHLPLAPGSDGYLFNGLLSYLDKHQFVDRDFTDHHTQGLQAALEAAKQSSADTVTTAKHCHLDVASIEQFFALFASSETTVTVFSQGINQSSTGVDKGNAIINCHLLSGKIGKTGSGPFSFTGQPNAMGGREVGGLANQLAAHMDIDNSQHRDKVQRFWQSPQMPQQQGLKAVDLFEAMHNGKIKLLWVMATNPAVSLPDSNKVREALQICDTVIVSDCVRHNDTLQYADICLPVISWGERDGTVTNTDRTISRQRHFLPAPGEAKADWQIVTEVANQLGYAKDFPYQSSVDVFREHAALSAFENEGERCFDIGRLSNITADEYQQFSPQQWPIKQEENQTLAIDGSDSTRLFTDKHFYTANGKANFIAVEPVMPLSILSSQYPFRLNTGRVRDHWHTLTRTGISPRLSVHIEESFVEINPQDAKQKGIEDKRFVYIKNDYGRLCLKAKITDAQQLGELFVPMHWNDQFNNAATVSRLVPAITDPISGQPESKHAVAQIEAANMLWHGFVLSRRKLSINAVDYWSCKAIAQGWQYEIAGESSQQVWEEFARTLLCEECDDSNWVEFFDRGQQTYRGARFIGKQLESCLFISNIESPLPAKKWLASLFLEDELDDSNRQALLSGKPSIPLEDDGQTICSCFNVGEKKIIKVIAEQGVNTVEQIGQLLKAGTNCGSCIPELKEYL